MSNPTDEAARAEAFAMLAKGLAAMATHRPARARIARVDSFKAADSGGMYEYEFTISIYTVTQPLKLRMTAADVQALELTGSDMGPAAPAQRLFLDWYALHFNEELDNECAELRPVLAYLDGLRDSGGLSREGNDHIEKARFSLGAFCRLISALRRNLVRHDGEPADKEKKP